MPNYRLNSLYEQGPNCFLVLNKFDVKHCSVIKIIIKKTKMKEGKHC